MKPIILRDEDPPDDTIVVVRGGEMQSDFVRHTALDAHDELGIYAVSVFLALDDPVDVLCRHEPYLARYGKIRLSTAGRLRADGFVLIPTLGRPHYDIVLPDIGAVTLGHLDACFDTPVPNPGHRKTGDV